MHNSFFFQALELAINYTQLFHAKKNRVEIISDFPDGNDAEVTFMPATYITRLPRSYPHYGSILKAGWP